MIIYLKLLKFILFILIIYLAFFRMLFKCKNGADLAVSTFKKNINFYHPICAENIAKELKLK